MESGAKGCEVVVSGKLRAARAKSMKFTDGFMIHSGQPVISPIHLGLFLTCRPATLSIPLPATSSSVKVSLVLKLKSSLTNFLEERARNLFLMLSSSWNPRKWMHRKLDSHVVLMSILVRLKLLLLLKNLRGMNHSFNRVDILKLDFNRRFINRQCLYLHN